MVTLFYQIRTFLRRKKIYEIFVSPLINVLFSALGNTAGIWFGYVLINYIFRGIWENLTWPGIDSLINEGVLLLVSFSFLSVIIYQTTRRLKINFFNVTSIIVLLVVASYYARVIAIGFSENNIVNDTAIHKVSLLSFWGSLLLLYITLVHEKWIINSGDAGGNRNIAYNNLKNEVQ